MEAAGPKEMRWEPRGWGGELHIANGPLFCGKLLKFMKDKRCSWHRHVQKTEVFYLQSGRLRILYSFDDDKFKAKELILEPGMNFHVPIGLRHQMIALEDSELFEFSTQHFDSDSYRIERGD